MEATMSTAMVPQARESARKLLKEHEVAPFDPDIVAEGNEILKKYER
jgi:hypothetical protein